MPSFSFFDDVTDFFSSLPGRFSGENERRRREDRALEIEIEEMAIQDDPLVKPKVVSVDLQEKVNALNHNCEKYELIQRTKDTVIIRRGAVLALQLELNQEINFKTEHKLIIRFSFGARPLVSKGTLGVIEVTGKEFFDESRIDWDHRVVEQNGETASIEILIPVDVPVGVWMLSMELKNINDNDPANRHLYRSDSVIYILFNPWSKEDDVYLGGEEKRQEYILNDIGKIWRGSYPTPKASEWVFGQFDDAVLPASILLLERSGLQSEERGDPVLVTRAISKMVNSNDDDGVIVGRWDSEYDDGTRPSAWTGSIGILEEFLTKGKPVKYGQCWVFSGVVTTVCRAIGIPCRSVSNLNSGHDTNKSLTIDKYFDETGEEFKPTGYGPRPEGDKDSIWNFHVWNDVWMTRHDLPKGYGGWQAIDSTPQERSNGIYQCGPASLEAVRNGQSNLNYDVNFVLAEVNADVVRWQRDHGAKDGFKILSSNKTTIGLQLLTKKAVEEGDGDNREDCTVDYKAPEGSKAERVTLYRAANRSRAARHAFGLESETVKDVTFALEDLERVPIGQDFSVKVTVKNISDSLRTISLVFCASSEYYTGIKAEIIKKAEGQFHLDPEAEDSFELPVTYNEYYDKLVEYSMIKLRAIANVKETNQTWIEEDSFQVMKPDINIEFLEDAVIGKKLPAQFSFQNPLDKVLRKCVLTIDGPGLTRPKNIPIENVEANGEMNYKISVYPKREGKRSLIATFNSKELIDVTGSSSIQISQ